MNKPNRTPTNRELMAAKKPQAPNGPSSVPAVKQAAAVAVPDNRSYVQRYLDDVAPASLVGRRIKFSKEGDFVTADDGEDISEETDFIALCDETLIGWIKFNGVGQAPDQHMGLLYDNFQMPPRESLGDLDMTQWEEGLDGKPADPWGHHLYVVLQNVDTKEMFTFTTSSPTGRRAVGNLLRHYDRMRKTHPDELPVVRLKPGGYKHKDDRVGWVPVPLFVVFGRAPRDSAARPDTSTAEVLQDEIPF